MLVKVFILVAIIACAVGAFAGWTVCDIRRDDMEKKGDKNSSKIFTFYMMLNHWLKIKQNGRDILTYFHDHGYETVAIYGMKELGERLLDELAPSDVKVLYAIDRNKTGIYTEVEILTPDDELPKVDAVIVTAVTFYEEIRRDMESRIDCPVISLTDVVYYEPE